MCGFGYEGNMTHDHVNRALNDPDTRGSKINGSRRDSVNLKSMPRANTDSHMTRDRDFQLPSSGVFWRWCRVKKRSRWGHEGRRFTFVLFFYAFFYRYIISKLCFPQFIFLLYIHSCLFFFFNSHLFILFLIRLILFCCSSILYSSYYAFSSFFFVVSSILFSSFSISASFH